MKTKLNNTSPSFDISAWSKAKELKSRILFTLGIIIIFRLGSYVPLPGVDPVVLKDISTQNSGGILGIFNVLSGGSLGRMSLFALSIMPYITASIVMQLAAIVSPTLANIKKNGEIGRKKINFYTKIMTIFLSVFQGLGISFGLESMSSPLGAAVVEPGIFFRVVSVTSLTGGTVFLMWLGEQITARGIGNGISILIFSGIVAGLPTAFASTFDLVRSGELSELFIVFFLTLFCLLIAVVIFFERSQRKILVQYSSRQVGNKMYSGTNSYMPLKLNASGVIPPIFASAILLFPMTLSNLAKSADGNSFFESLAIYLGHGKPLYIFLYTILIIIFCFFYTPIVFNTEETAENLQKNNGFILGRRPGKSTAEYLSSILTKITVIGSGYLALVCVLPEIIVSTYAVPFYLGGTSILIIVNVIMDTMTQIQTHLFSHQYQSLIKKSGLRRKSN